MAKRAKTIKLDKELWLRAASDIKVYRKEALEKQDGKCAISGVPLEVGVLDHTHKDGCGEDGRCRGVLLSEINMLEGRYLKLFKRLKLDIKYGLTFPEFLISMGEYLQKDNSESPMHHKFMDDFRKQVSRYRKDTLVRKLKEEFNMGISPLTTQGDLVQIYIQNWVYRLEKEMYDY